MPTWNQAIRDKLQRVKRLSKYEDSEFYTQINDFDTVDIPIHDGKLTYWYWNNTLNAGDYYNQYLIRKLYKCPVEFVKDKGQRVDICFCGSVLLNEHVTKCHKVMGCGIQTKNHPSNLPANTAYVALRGKITRRFVNLNRTPKNKDILLCDPGLMLSYLYKPSKPIEKKHKLGIIVHYVDEKEVRKRYGGKYHIISMQTRNIEALANDILSCEVILSSSLHGLIFAHSYGVPAYHVQFTDFFKNGNFKFSDYYSSFEGIQYKKYVCKDFKMDVQEILKYHEECCATANPTQEMVMEKQRQFLLALPYRQYLKNPSGSEKEATEAETSPETDLSAEKKPDWKFSEFMHG